tara:strand:+ start:36 stop:311 length:276 start_codon:yes stop_codon:yes gene_type:complete
MIYFFNKVVDKNIVMLVGDVKWKNFECALVKNLQTVPSFPQESIFTNYKNSKKCKWSVLFNTETYNEYKAYSVLDAIVFICKNKINKIKKK